MCVCVSHGLCVEPCTAASSLCLSERVNVTQITDASRFLDRAHVLHSSGLFISQLPEKKLFSIFSIRNKKTGEKFRIVTCEDKTTRKKVRNLHLYLKKCQNCDKKIAITEL